MTKGVENLEPIPYCQVPSPGIVLSKQNDKLAGLDNIKQQASFS